MPVLNPDHRRMSPEQLALAQEWHRAAAIAKQWEDYERKCRDALVAALCPGTVDGTFNADAGNGFIIRTVKQSRRVVSDSTAMRELVGKFAAHAETAEAGQALLKWKPSLSVRAYNALPLWGRGLFDPFITTIPNAPQVELIAPKG